MGKTTMPNLNDALLSATVRQLLINSDDYIFMVDTDLVYRMASDSTVRLVGKQKKEDVLGKTDFDIFPKDLAEKYQADDRRVLETGKPIIGELERLPDSEGKERWTQTWKYPIYDKQGNLTGLYGISRDVTRMVSLEAEAETAKKYANLIDNIPGGIAIFHQENGNVFLDYANTGYYRAHYMSPEFGAQFLGANVINSIYEPDRKLVIAEYTRVIKQKDTFGQATFRTCGEDGNTHWVNIQFSAAYVENGVQYYYASFTGLDEQKHAEERLAESQGALREAVVNSDIQFFTYFPDKHLCEIYTASNRQPDLPLTWENFPDDFFDYTHAAPEDAQACREALAKIVGGADSAECTIKLPSYRGGLVWERLCLKAIRDPEGKLIRAQGYSLNITGRKAAEERLRKERLRVKALEGNTFEALSFNLTRNSLPEFQSSDSGLLIEPISKELEDQARKISSRLAGVRPETRSILLHAAARIPDPEERYMFLSACSGDGVRKDLKGGHYGAFRYRRKIGDLIHWASSKVEVLPDPTTGDLIAFFYTQDINDEVINEKISAQINRRNYETISFLDLQTGKLFVKTSKDPSNTAFQGTAYQEVIDTAITKLDKSEDESELRQKLDISAIKADLEKNPSHIIYYTRTDRREDLPSRPHCKIKCDIFYLDENKDILVYLFSDVTEIFEQDQENKEKMEAALIAAKQASSAKSNFLSRMSHEIRTPLNAIIGMDTIAAQSLGNPEKMADCISKIGISARYLLSLINDILDMSRIESGKMLLKNEKFMFKDFISNINTMIFGQTKAKGLDYECTISNTVAEAYIGDSMKLQQVLINILGNSVKFTQKGKISFDVHPLSEHKGQPIVRFTVTDTGIGIREDFLENIFEPFEQGDSSSTTTFGGTGLGLAITKNIVNLMGGTIKVRSIVGTGSEFTIDVPLTIDASIKIQPKLNFHFEKMRTLIVDDDLVVCEQANGVLRDIGMVGEWVTSGHEAIEKVRVNFEKNSFYDFILVDWKMPDMDGLETTRQIRKVVGPDVTIIIITAYDWESIEAEARAAGANMLISKPLLKTTLVSAFEKARGISENEQQSKINFDFTGKRVLVAEDNAINAEIAKALLESKHFTIELAENGLKALELYTQRPANYYDAILMDIRMPLMDGLQTTTNIRHWNKADAKSIPIIAMTANAFDEDVEKSKAAGMNAHLSKPIDQELMFTTLYRFIFEKE